MIKTIFFDLGNVIVFFTHSIALYRIIATQKSRTGKILSEEELHRFIFKSGLCRKFDNGNFPAEIFYRKIQKKFNLQISFSEFKKIWKDIFWLNADMSVFIKKAKKKYKLHLISNTDPVHLPYVLKKFPVMNCFDMVFASYKLKVSKPVPKIFRIALGKTNTIPAESIYIDDIKENVDAARSLGINGIHYTNIKEFYKKLGQYIK